MKILHINTSDRGGAANACLRIHDELLKQGVDSKVLVLKKEKNHPEVYRFNYFEGTKSFLEYIVRRIKLHLHKRKERKRLGQLPPNPVLFSFPTTIYDITKHPLYKEADIIQLNWVNDFLDERSFFKKNKKPVIWRTSDLYICGGGNHYEKNFTYKDFEKFTSSNLAIRKKALTNKKINIVAISNWVEEKVLQSDLVKHNPITTITNGIDLNIFKQYDKNLCLSLWNLPSDKIIILVGADSVKDPRKGVRVLIEALSRIKNDNIYLCAFGREKSWNPDIHMLGTIYDERLLATLYSAADYFIMTSLEEAFGQVTLEALACGTPVISLPNGGSKDMIINGMNGILATDFTVEALVEAINQGLNTNFDRNKIREDTSNRFNIEDKAKRYINLYNNILDK